MKRNYLMTGMKYPCKGDVRLLKSTMEHLEKTMPEMLVVKTYNKYGAVLKVVEADDEAEMEATRGVISRMDLPEMLQLMVFTGYDVLKARMVELSVQGAFAVLEVDVPEGFVTRQDAEGDSVWDDWSWMDALATDGVLDYEMFSEAEEAIKMLDLGLEKPGTLSDAMMMRNISRLIKASRCDVSKETQAALARYRRLVAAHPSERVRAMRERLVKAINDIGSAERREAFRAEYYPRIKARFDDRRKLMEMLHTDLDGEMLRRSAYEALKRLPDNLFLDMMDKGELMHRLLYLDGGIPRKKLYMLFDALSVWDNDEVYVQGDMHDETADSELFHFVHPLLEDDKAWDIHRCVRHLVSRFGVQEICGYLSELKNEKKILLPQSLLSAYEELRRMGMPCDAKGYDYKTFAKHYNK